ncbi:hypothetical protein [Pseudonocardia abyssalis]|uniref:ARB-07466-like C-terminal domain-containing protein n=1 Tax=Pseudonocardia abyssalis TaxID=2792008 RepID=A0ABS6UX19_9PSEU|nr:hypothetical protein [Pseudonocardia abyssalis]MBW0115186.1 hypothetical protein [Pseudonocardia abyssalis]MBW0136761.1 hypothetical protein [Pseudonocardia abyssalis]
MVRLLSAALALLVGFLLLGAAPAQEQADPVPGVDAAAVPEAAREWLPLIGDLTATGCPELPPVWVVAQVQVESGWDASLVDDAAGGPAGLYQFDRDNWLAAGGTAWSADPPTPDDDVTDVEGHLRVAVPWICTNLRAVARHLEDTGKSADPLDAMLVCHLAGCGRVAGSATGVPVAGEAGCGERCADVVRRYLDAVHAEVDRFSGGAAGPDPEAPAVGLAAPAPWTGGGTGCEMTDPTGDGCLTGAALHGLEAASAAFGGWSDGPVIRSAGCWDEHAWNPRSDHPRGKACDLFPGTPGAFAEGTELDAGWRVADWFRTHADPLAVEYLIWQGRYWDPGVADQDGWGRRYTGGGVYDARDATGGHYDHVHVSFRE